MWWFPETLQLIQVIHMFTLGKRYIRGFIVWILAKANDFGSFFFSQSLKMKWNFINNIQPHSLICTIHFFLCLCVIVAISNPTWFQPYSIPRQKMRPTFKKIPPSGIYLWRSYFQSFKDGVFNHCPFARSSKENSSMLMWNPSIIVLFSYLRIGSSFR